MGGKVGSSARLAVFLWGEASTTQLLRRAAAGGSKTHACRMITGYIKSTDRTVTVESERGVCRAPAPTLPDPYCLE